MSGDNDDYMEQCRATTLHGDPECDLFLTRLEELVDDAAPGIAQYKTAFLLDLVVSAYLEGRQDAAEGSPFPVSVLLIRPDIAEEALGN